MQIGGNSSMNQRARVMRLWGAPAVLINFIRPAIFAATHPTAAQRHETLSLSQNAKHTPRQHPNEEVSGAGEKNLWCGSQATHSTRTSWLNAHPSAGNLSNQKHSFNDLHWCFSFKSLYYYACDRLRLLFFIFLKWNRIKFLILLQRYTAQIWFLVDFGKRRKTNLVWT